MEFFKNDLKAGMQPKANTPTAPSLTDKAKDKAQQTGQAIKQGAQNVTQKAGAALKKVKFW